MLYVCEFPPANDMCAFHEVSYHYRFPPYHSCKLVRTQCNVWTCPFIKRDEE